MSPLSNAKARFHAWAAKDDNQLGWWLTSPIEQIRYHLGKALSELGAAVARLGHRIHDDAPGDFWDGYRDGQQRATVLAVAVPNTTREDVRQSLALVGLPSDDDLLERLGWKATA